MKTVFIFLALFSCSIVSSASAVASSEYENILENQMYRGVRAGFERYSVPVLTEISNLTGITDSEKLETYIKTFKEAGLSNSAHPHYEELTLLIERLDHIRGLEKNETNRIRGLMDSVRPLDEKDRILRLKELNKKLSQTGLTGKNGARIKDSYRTTTAFSKKELTAQREVLEQILALLFTSHKKLNLYTTPEYRFHDAFLLLSLTNVFVQFSYLMIKYQSPAIAFTSTASTGVLLFVLRNAFYKFIKSHGAKIMTAQSNNLTQAWTQMSLSAELGDHMELLRLYHEMTHKRCDEVLTPVKSRMRVEQQPVISSEFEIDIEADAEIEATPSPPKRFFPHE